MVKKNPKISVILPTHNRADVLPFAIESVLAQTEKDFELLIVGDGCTDNTKKVVRKYLVDKRVQWFDYPKAPGFGYANRNKIFKKMRGKYVAFMAHDDLILPDHLKLLSKKLEGTPSIDIIYSRPLWVSPQGTIMPSSFNMTHPKLLNHFLFVANAIPASCFMHRRSCFDRVGYWDEKLPECGDWDMWKRIIKSGDGKNFAFVSTPTALHFLANWRKTNKEWPHEKAVRVAGSKLYPPELKLVIPRRRTEQSILWKAISSNPVQWTRQTREACRALIDVLHDKELPDIVFLKRRIKLLEAQEIYLTGEVKYHMHELKEASEQLQAMRDSLTWRVHQKVFRVINPKGLPYKMLNKLRSKKV